MLRRPIRQTQKSGVYTYATVEDITLGYATVRLSGKGKRMTRLPVMGGTIAVGDRVMVDWSAGVPPLVRPIASKLEAETGLDSGSQLPEEGAQPVATDVSFKITRETTTQIGHEFSQIVWSKALWQTHNFFTTDNMNSLILPYDGYYYIHTTIGAQGFLDKRYLLPDPSSNMWGDTEKYGEYWLDPTWDPYWWDKYSTFKRKTAIQRVVGELRHTETGTFAVHMAQAIDTNPSIDTTMEFGGMIYGSAGSAVSLWLKHDDPDVEYVTLTIQENNLYPQIWGFRMTRGGIAEDYTYSPDDQVADDSDIEIAENMGYLHVSEASGETYARGIAMVGDYANLEIYLEYTFDDTTEGSTLRVFLRSTRDWCNINTPTRAYEMSINNNGGWGLHRIENGVRTLLDSVNEGSSALPHKLRFQASGTSIKAKTWLATESEPGWTLEIEDTGGFTAMGGMQLGYFNSTGSHKVYLDNLDLHLP